MDENNGIPSGTSHMQMNQNADGRESTHQLTINSVLHFLQSEWLKLEQQRAQWEMDRAELQAQVAFLQGERKGQENLKQDLIRRIKMLELALKSERSRFFSKSNGAFTGKDINATVKQTDDDQLLPAQRLKLETEKGQEYNQRWKQSRSRLKQYLEEIGCTDVMLDFRQARLRHSFVSSLGSGNEDPHNEITTILSSSKFKTDENLTNEELRPRFTNLYEMLSQKPQEYESIGGSSSYDETYEKRLDASGEFSSEDVQRKNPAGANFLNSLELGDLSGLSTDNETFDQNGMPCNYFNNDVMAKTETFGAKSQFLKSSNLVKYDASSSQPDQILRHKFTCCGHFDNIRTVCFDSTDSLLFSCSDDGLIMAWDLTKATSVNENSDELIDLEPTYVYRGHQKTVLTLLSMPTPITGKVPVTALDHPIILFSGGLDGRICSWTLPQNYPISSSDASSSSPTDKIDIYTAYRKSEDSGFVYSDGTGTPVWSLAMSPTNVRFIAAATASGLISLYQLNDSINSTSPFRQINLKETLREWMNKNFTGNNNPICNEVGTPTTLAFFGEIVSGTLGLKCSNSLPPLIVGTSSGWICLLDMLSGEKPSIIGALHSAVSSGNSGDSLSQKVTSVVGTENWTTAGIYSLTIHPTFARIWTGHEDHLVRQINVRMDVDSTLKMSVADSIKMHEDAVCSVFCDQNAGLYLYTAGVDGSLRIWDIEQHKCVQEIAAHRPKGHEALHGMCLHRLKPLLATAGADGTCKVFTQSNFDLAPIEFGNVN